MAWATPVFGMCVVARRQCCYNFYASPMRLFDDRPRSIEAMKMMDRAVASADAEFVGGRDRFREPCLGVAHALLQRLAFGEAGRNRRRQRASGAVGVFGFDARRRQRDHAVACEEIIDALAALPVAAFDQNGARTSREQPPALIFNRRLACRDVLFQK